MWPSCHSKKHVLVAVVGVATLGAAVATGDDRDARRLEHVASWGQVDRTPGAVTALAVSGDGRRVLAGHESGRLAAWDSVKGTLLDEWAAHDGRVTALALSRDGRRILSGGADGEVLLWTVVGGGHERHRVTSHDKRVLHHRWQSIPNGVLAVGFSEDGRRALSVGEDNLIRSTDLSTGWQDSTWVGGFESNVQHAAFSPDGELALVTVGQELELWRLDRRPLARVLTALRRTVTILDWHAWHESGDPPVLAPFAFSPDGERAVSVSRRNRLKVWDVPLGEELEVLLGSRSRVQAVALSRGGRLAASSAADGLTLWDEETGERLATADMRAGCMAFAGSGTLVAGTERGTVEVFEVHSGARWR